MNGRQLFGTDGIRGMANIYPMTCEVAVSLGRAVTHYFQNTHTRNKRPLIIIGKDTRLSCYMLEQAFAAGVCSQGGRAILTGPLPTPGVAFATKSMRADAGVVISASHNPFYDNGIKIFDGHGNKLPDQVELELEALVTNPQLIPQKLEGDLGNAKRLDEVFGRYIVHAKSAFADDYTLEDMRIVVDCANGAAYKIAPMILSELGAEVFCIGASPNGQNINLQCGALHPEKCQEEVIKYRADLGICLDGDADRVIMIDEKGTIVDGDRLIGILARLLKDTGKLKIQDKIVGTVMSNLGLEKYIRHLGLDFLRTKVGDRYIIEKMKDTNSILGGEPSGHIILSEFSSTGDGMLSALKVIESMKFYRKNLSEMVAEVGLYPQVLQNVTVGEKRPLESVPLIQTKLAQTQEYLGERGRVILRYSGTENLARVMIEGEDEKLIHQLCSELAVVVSSALAK